MNNQDLKEYQAKIKKHKILKSYLLQFHVLGYYIHAGMVCTDKSEIMKIVNSHINRKSSYIYISNAEALIYSRIQVGSCGQSLKQKFQCAMKKDFYTRSEQNDLGLSEYDYEMSRLARKCKKKGIQMLKTFL